MLRYKTKTRPGLVALYDIRPGNGAGQFLQPQSSHGASGVRVTCEVDYLCVNFGLPSLSVLELFPMYTTDRGQTASSLNVPA